MRKWIGVVVFALLCAGSAYGQTNTPTATNTPTNTPTFVDTTKGVFTSGGSVLRTCQSVPCYSDWMAMPDDPVFEFELMSGTRTWKLWCRMHNYHPMEGVQMTFDNGAATVAADAILTLNGPPAPGTPVPDRSFVDYCRIEIDADSSGDGIVRFGPK